MQQSKGERRQRYRIIHVSLRQFSQRYDKKEKGRRSSLDDKRIDRRAHSSRERDRTCAYKRLVHSIRSAIGSPLIQQEIFSEHKAHIDDTNGVYW